MTSNQENIFWQNLAQDPELWHEEVFHKFPSVVAHEYERLRRELECGSPFSAMLQIKDVMETLLKFEVLLAYAWASEKKVPDFQKKAGCLITTRNLSLGAWMELARRIIDFFKSSKEKMPPSLLEPLKKIRSFYNKKEFVNWRNETVGHGALSFSENEEFRNDIREKIVQLRELFEGIGSLLSEQMIWAKEDGLLLMGAQNARGLEKCDGEIQFKNDEIDLSFNISPYMQVYNGCIYFFDNQKKAQRTQRLSYTTGGRKDEYVEYFTQLDALREEQGIRLELPADSNFMSMDEETYLNRLGLGERFIEPMHLTTWLKEQIHKNDKGVYLLKMPRGTGKSSFAEKLNCLYAKPLKLDEDIDVRTYHISRTQLRSDADFERGIETQWQFAYEQAAWTGFKRIADYRGEGSTPAQALAAFLAQVQKYTDYRRGCERIVMVLDGLDEIAQDEIWNYIPSADMLEEGVHILLTSRDPDAEDDLPPQLVDRLNGLCLQECLTVRKDSEDNISFLRAYAKKEAKADKEQIEELIRLAQQRVLYLSMYCELLRSGMAFKELPRADKLCERFIGEIRQRYGEKKTNDLHRVLNVLSGIGRFEPLSLEEIAELAGESCVTFQLLGVMNDLRAIIKVSRGYASDEQQYGGENRYSVVNPDMAHSLFELLPHAGQSMRQMAENVFSEFAAENRGDTFSDGDMIVLSHAAELFSMAGADARQALALSETVCLRIADALRGRMEPYLLTMDRLKGCHLQLMEIYARADRVQAELYHGAGRILSEQRKTEEALTYYHKAREILEQPDEAGSLSDQEPLAKLYNNIAGTFASRKEMEEALKYHHKARQIREQMLEGGGLSVRSELAKTYNNIAAALFHMGDMQQAMYFYDKARQIDEQLDSEGKLSERMELATIYSNIADTLANQNKTEEALRWHEKAYEIERQLEADDKLPSRNYIAMTYNGMAAVLVKQEKTDQALRCLLDAQQIQRQLDEEGRLPDRSNLSTTYNNIAVVYTKQKNPQEALAWFDKARQIMEQLEKNGRLPDRNELAVTYSNMARTLLECGKQEEALSFLEKAEAIQRQLDREGRLPDRKFLVITCTSKAEVFAKQGKTDKALNCFNEAGEILEQLDREGKMQDRDELLDIYRRIAVVHHKRGNKEALFSCLNKIKAIQTEIDREGSLSDRNDLARTIEGIAYILAGQGKLKEAMSQYEKVRDIRLQLEQEGKLSDKNELANTYNNMAHVFFRQGKTEKALSCFQKVRTIREALDKSRKLKDESELAAAYHNIALILLRQKKKAEALSYLKKACGILEWMEARRKLKDREKLIIVYNTMAEILLSQNKKAEAVMYFGKAQALAALL